MKTRINRRGLMMIAGLCSGFALSAAASADTVTAKYTSTYAKTVDITSPVNNGNVNTVQFHWTRQDSPGPGVDGTVPTNFTTYCVDLAQHVSANTNYTFDAMSPAVYGFTATQTTLLENLWSAYFPSINSADTSAAFQVAIWEIVYDTGLSLTSGAFDVNTSGTVRTTAQNWLNAVSATTFVRSGPGINLVVLKSATAQDQLTNAPPLVPTPATAVIGAAGMFLASSRRRGG